MKKYTVVIHLSKEAQEDNRRMASIIKKQGGGWTNAATQLQIYKDIEKGQYNNSY